MGAIVANYKSQHTESRKNYIFKEFNHYSCIICRRGYIIDPFRYVTDGNKYVFITERRWKGPIKSISQTSKTSTSKIPFSGISSCLEILSVRWHRSQFITSAWTYFHRLGQKRSDCKIFAQVFEVFACPP